MKKSSMISLLAGLSVLLTALTFTAEAARSITFRIKNSTDQSISATKFWGDEGECKIITPLTFTCKTNAEGKLRYAMRFIVNGNFKSMNFPILWLLYPDSQNQSLIIKNLSSSGVSAALSSYSWSSDNQLVTITFSKIEK